VVQVGRGVFVYRSLSLSLYPLSDMFRWTPFLSLFLLSSPKTHCGLCCDLSLIVVVLMQSVFVSQSGFHPETEVTKRPSPF